MTIQLTNEFREERKTLALQGKRRCNNCELIKDLNIDFDNDKHGANGKTGHCKDCRNQKARERHHRFDGLQGALDNGYKRAAKAGRPRRKIQAKHQLNTWKKAGIDPMRCFHTGTLLTLEPGKPNTRNIDHVQPLAVKGTAGHVSKNIVPCTAEYNRYKMNKEPLSAFLQATEELQPVQSYAGYTEGMVGTDFYGNPNSPVIVKWVPSEKKGEPELMSQDMFVQLFPPEKAN